MPTLMELQRRFAVEPDESGLGSSDESLVMDLRGRMTPSQVVERKLRSLLHQDASGTARDLNRKRPK